MKKTTPRSKQLDITHLLRTGGLFLAVVGMITAGILVNTSADLRQQAAGLTPAYTCSNPADCPIGQGCVGGKCQVAPPECQVAAPLISDPSIPEEIVCPEGCPVAKARQGFNCLGKTITAITACKSFTDCPDDHDVNFSRACVNGKCTKVNPGCQALAPTTGRLTCPKNCPIKVAKPGQDCTGEQILTITKCLRNSDCPASTNPKYKNVCKRFTCQPSPI